MGGRGRLLPGERYTVWDDWMEGSSGWEALIRLHCCNTITDKIWRAYAGSWHRPRKIPTAASEVSTGKLSKEAGFGETSGRQSHSTADALRGAQFVTDRDCEASSTCKLSPQHIASLANHHIEIGFGRRYGDGSCVTGSVDCQVAIFDNVSCVKAICEPVLLLVSLFCISVTKLWDRIIPQCVCKGCMGHPKVLDPKSSWLTNNELYMVLPVKVKW
jgi:hypothetical protein